MDPLVEGPDTTTLASKNRPEPVVMKFGGSSLASPELIENAAGIVSRAASSAPVAVVVSAMGNTTDEIAALSDRLGASPPDRESDRMLATGELLSAAAMARALRVRGHRARSLSGSEAGIHAVGVAAEGRIQSVDPGPIRECFERSEVAVIAGFQAATENDELITLGRGGSDTTAVALASALGVSECLIYSDVDGVHTADPRLVAVSSRQQTVPYEVMTELSSAGAKVMHTRAVELADSAGIDIRLRRATPDVASGGTLIGSKETNSAPLAMELLGPSAVAHDLDVARVLIRSLTPHEDLAVNVIQLLAEHNTPIDLVARSGAAEDEFRMGFTMRQSDLGSIDDALRDLVNGQGGSLLIDRDVAKLSVIGTGMASKPWVAAQMLELLRSEGVSTSWLSITTKRISVLVPATSVPDMVPALHTTFELDRERGLSTNEGRKN